MARRLKVASAQNAVIVVRVVKVRVEANIHLIKSVHSIRIDHAARAVKVVANVKAAINRPS